MLYQHVVKWNETDSYTWEMGCVDSFDELIVSWNAARPKIGAYQLRVSVYTTHWLPWMDYAYWGASSQYTYKGQYSDCIVDVDTVTLLDGKKATGFRVKVTPLEGSTSSFYHINASTITLKNHFVDFVEPAIDIALNVPKLSQMALISPLAKRLCSPTSVSACLIYLSSFKLDPLQLAPKVYDQAFDIYGNWILNVAEAAHILGPSWHSYIIRCTHFDQVLKQLQKGIPVVVSVKGHLKGSPQDYDSGHLIVVKGYSTKHKKVLCMDPAFPSDELTEVMYDCNDFLTAWRNRGGLAYFFDRT